MATKEQTKEQEKGQDAVAAYRAKARARAAEVSLESCEPVTLPATKLVVDVRAITEAQRGAAAKAATSDNLAFMHAVIAAACYVPGTDARIFVADDGADDVAMIGAFPPVDVDTLYKAALRVLAYDKTVTDALGNG